MSQRRTTGGAIDPLLWNCTAARSWLRAIDRLSAWRCAIGSLLCSNLLCGNMTRLSLELVGLLSLRQTLHGALCAIHGHLSVAGVSTDSGLCRANSSLQHTSLSLLISFLLDSSLGFIHGFVFHSGSLTQSLRRFKTFSVLSLRQRFAASRWSACTCNTVIATDRFHRILTSILSDVISSIISQRCTVDELLARVERRGCRIPSASSHRSTVANKLSRTTFNAGMRRACTAAFTASTSCIRTGCSRHNGTNTATTRHCRITLTEQCISSHTCACTHSITHHDTSTTTSCVLQAMHCTFTQGRLGCNTRCNTAAVRTTSCKDAINKASKLSINSLNELPTKLYSPDGEEDVHNNSCDN